MSTEAIESNVREVDAAMAAVISEVTRLHSDGVHLPALRRRVDEAVTCIQKLVSALAPVAAESPPDEPLDDTPISPEDVAKIEFEAGREIALSGDVLLDQASDAAKAGFASVLESNGETPASGIEANGESKSEPPSY